ncbi:MAG: crossover junction endodeoxyribonuclease RuvC [Ignavibacteria bacterium GWF2_33_9]|nr:MAG: crossover junction endodeoxyribonuclease RuvC [Ignavibacteria bacterium GWF2_33_9]
MKILGIDPGSVLLGYGAIESRDNSLVVIEYGVVKAKLIEDDYYKRLNEIFIHVGKIIERVSPDVMSFETMFYHKNAQSLIKLSQARAAAVLAAVSRNIEIIEYSPKEVKKSVTGNGNASKQQVQYMIQSLLKIEEKPKFLDSSDALAIALCHFYKQGNSTGKNNKVKSWGDFAKQNPDRVV